MSMLDNMQGSNIAQSVKTGGIAGGLNLKPQPVGGGSANYYVNGVRVTAGNQASPVETKKADAPADTILGMSKPVFYGLGAVVVIGVGFYLYKRQK
jgi:hypothetical protein